MTTNHSTDCFKQASHWIPGGVNSPVRACKHVGGTPIFIDHAKGAYLYDIDDNRYIDYVLSWGPMILGHAHPQVVQAVTTTAQKGLSFGAPTELETQLAQTLCQTMPALEQIRMVNSGTEATMSAIRLARAYTGRDKIITFEGCYHGHADSLLVKAGSGALTFGIPSSPGVPKALADCTIPLEYNHHEAVIATLDKIGDQVAAIIVEPVAGNMGCVPPTPEFLPTLREQCDRHGCLLIIDEVMTGFRLGLSGAQGVYSITPDITTLGKVIGGGMPVGAFGGKRAIMEQLAPNGPVYQAGTLSGNPVAMAAGLATLAQVSASGFFDALFAKTTTLTAGLRDCAKRYGVPVCVQQAGSMFGVFFTEEPAITRYHQVLAADRARFKRFFHSLLQWGIYWAPSPFEASFMSSAHSDDDIAQTLDVADRVFSAL